MRILFKQPFNDYAVSKPLWELEQYLQGRTQSQRLATNKLYWDNYYRFQAWDGGTAEARTRYFYRAVIGLESTLDLEREKVRNHALHTHLSELQANKRYFITRMRCLRACFDNGRPWFKGIPPSESVLPRRVYFRKHDLLLVRVSETRVDVELLKRNGKVLDESEEAIASFRRNVWDELSRNFTVA